MRKIILYQVHNGDRKNYNLDIYFKDIELLRKFLALKHKTQKKNIYLNYKQ